ncbi:MAG: hypothetical protein ABI693_33070 [Bryobacteraceae bacterium]
MKKVALLTMLVAASAFAAEWTGYISETKCGAKHADASDGSIKCVTGCIKGGASAVLVVDGRVVAIHNTDAVPAALYGKKVTVSGEMSGDAVHVAKIEAAK